MFHAVEGEEQESTSLSPSQSSYLPSANSDNSYWMNLTSDKLEIGLQGCGTSDLGLKLNSSVTVRRKYHTPGINTTRRQRVSTKVSHKSSDNK